MKHERRIPAKALSFLLALVMLLSCITIGFTALAVEDSYQVLADAMRAEGMSGAIPTYKSSASPDVKSKLNATDPLATSAVYVQSTAMWNAMEAFWNIAGSVRSSDTGNITVDDNGNVYEGWTGENNTARKIAASIASKLVSGGYMTSEEVAKYGVFDTFNWFIGGYTAEYALLDEPLRSEKETLLPWTHQVFGSTGYFGVSRTRDDALLSGTKNYKQIPGTLVLNERWTWAHDPRYQTSKNGSFRQYWHVLNKTSVDTNVTGVDGLGFDPAQADTTALKAAFAQWDNLFKKSFLEQDLSGLNVEQLQELEDKTEAAIAAAKAQDITNSLLYYYGLPTYLDVGTFQRAVDYHQTLAPYRPSVDYFQDTLSERKIAKLNDDALKSEIIEARTNYEILAGVSLDNQSVYSGLVTVNGLDLAAAEEYLGAMTLALSDPTPYMQDIVDVVSTYLVVNGGVYDPNGYASTVTLDELYAAYETVSIANATITGSIAGVAHFPGYDLGTALTGAGVTIANVSLILAGLMKAINAQNPASFYDYRNTDNIPTALVGNVNDNYVLAVTPAPSPEAYERYPESFKASKPANPVFTAPTNPTIVMPGAIADVVALIEGLSVEQQAAAELAVPGSWTAMTVPSLYPYVAGTTVDADYIAAATAVVNALNLANAAAIAAYNTDLANFNLTSDWIAAYEAKWLAPAKPVYNDADVPEFGADLAAYITAAEAFLSGLAMTADQKDFMLEMGGLAYPTDGGDMDAYANDLFVYIMMISALDWSMNAEYPLLGSLEDKFNYFAAAGTGLEARLAAYADYQAALDGELSIAKNAYSYLMTMQKEYELKMASGTAAEIEAANFNYVSAANNYQSKWVSGGLTTDGTTAIAANDPAYEVRNYRRTEAKYEFILGKIDVLTRVGVFFDDYRLSFNDAKDATGLYLDWGTYSDDQLRQEYEDAQNKLKEYEDSYATRMSEYVTAYVTAGGDIADLNQIDTTKWYAYFGNNGNNGAYDPDTAGQENKASVRDAIRNRVEVFLKGISTAYKPSEYVEVIDASGNFQFQDGFLGVGPTYNINTIGLLTLLTGTDYREGLDAALVRHAQDILAAVRGLTFEYDTLHWDLWSGDFEAFPDKEWQPVREVHETSSIVLVYEQDEFEVKYEHIENVINKLDTLISSQFIVELLGEDGLDINIGGSSGEEEPGTLGLADDGVPDPAFHIPKLDGSIIMRLGEMRYSSKETEITDPDTGITIKLPKIETQRDTGRVVDPETETYAERRWIQAYRADVLLYLLHYIFEAINTGEQEGREMFSWILKTILGDNSLLVNGESSEQYLSQLEMPDGLQETLTGVAEEATTMALTSIDLSAAAEPFLTELLNGLVADNLYSDMLPNTVIGLYQLLCNLVWPMFNGPLFGADGLIDDIELFAGLKISTLLGYLNISSINDLFNSEFFSGLFDFIGSGSSVTNLLEILLGAQITPHDLVTKCWPTHWPKGDGVVPAGAPEYVTLIKDDLAAAYNWLNTPGNFAGTGEAGTNTGTNNGLDSWVAITSDDISENLKWGLDKLAGRADQRQAFIDVMAFSMSGISFLLSAVFSDTGLNIKFLNQGVEGSKDDSWYVDIIIPMGWLNSFLNGIIKVLNYIPFVNIKEVNIPDIKLSNILTSWPHWRGNFDSRAGVFATLSSVNAYGKLFIPLFELLNIDPILFGEYSITPGSALASVAELQGLEGEQYSEKTLNTLMTYLGKDIAGVVKKMNAGTATEKAQARDTMYEISHILIDALLMPLFNWIAPEDDALIPFSIGFRPVGKVLDLLPNLAFVVEKKLIPQTVNDVLGGLVLDVEVCLGGFEGKQLANLIKSIGLEDILYNMIDGIVRDLLTKYLGSFISMILGTISGGIGWLVAQVINLAVGAGGGIIDLIKEHSTSAHPGRSNLGILVGFFGGDGAAKALTIEVVKLEIMGMVEGLLKYDKYPNSEVCTEHDVVHDGLFGYLDHAIGIDLTGDLDSLIQGAIGLIGIADKPLDGPPTISDDPAVEQTVLGLIDKVVQNENHIEGFLFELFNPQTYPNKTYMTYALVESAKAGSAGATLNEVNYSEVWTEEKANYLNDHLMSFLNNLWQFLFAQDFLDWLWETLEGSLGIDIQNLYTTENLQAILEMISPLLSGLDLDSLLSGDMMEVLLPVINAAQDLVDIDDLLFTVNVLKYYADPSLIPADDTTGIAAEIARIKGITVSSRNDFTGVIYDLLAPLAPILKIFLTGGRTTDAKGNLYQTIWYGELYPNNGAADTGYFAPGNQTEAATENKNYVYNTRRYLEMEYTGAYRTAGYIIPNAWSKSAIKEYDPKGTLYTISSEGDNLTLLEDYLGFSGYDGYRQGLIPIYEHLGVPAEDILTYQQFVDRASDPVTGNSAFFGMLLDPILNLVDRVIEDPINTVMDILPNLLYFITAEHSAADIAANDDLLKGSTNLNECLNRLLRPIYAIVDMLAPLLTVDEILGLLPMFGVDISDMLTDGHLPINIKVSDAISIPIDLPIQISLNDIVSGLLSGIDLGGLKIELTDLTKLITGELEIYKSQSGQEDAVRINGNLPDLLTNLIRMVIELLFTEENKPIVMGLLSDVGIPEALQPLVDQLIGNIYGLMADNTLQGHIGADLVLSMLFYLFYDVDSLAQELLNMRDTYSARIINMFEIVAGSSSPQLRRYAERARRILDLFYGDIIDPDKGVQESGFIAYVTKFFAKVGNFFTSIGDWFMKIIRWLFPYFF